MCIVGLRNLVPTSKTPAAEHTLADRRDAPHCVRRRARGGVAAARDAQQRRTAAADGEREEFREKSVRAAQRGAPGAQREQQAPGHDRIRRVAAAMCCALRCAVCICTVKLTDARCTRCAAAGEHPLKIEFSAMVALSSLLYLVRGCAARAAARATRCSLFVRPKRARGDHARSRA
jgi:hypothetical protein